MARKTAKKQAEAPKVDIGAEIFASLRELEKLKGIPVDYMVERLKQALTNAYRKDREDRRDVPADNVVVDLSEKGLSMHIVKTAVEEVEDTALEIPIDAARNYNPDVQVGDPVNIPVDIQKFGRIAAQTAKQVVIQGIREAERGVAYESYSNKAQELMIGTVLRIDPPPAICSCASVRVMIPPTPCSRPASRFPAKPTKRAICSGCTCWRFTKWAAAR